MTDRFMIERLADGGFVVANPDMQHRLGEYPRPYFQFASTSVDKALEYVKGHLLQPKAPK